MTDTEPTLAIVLSIILVGSALGTAAVPTAATAAAAPETGERATPASVADPLAAAGDAPIAGADRDPARSAPDGGLAPLRRPLSPVDWSLSPSAAADGTVESGHHDYPPARHLGFGAPDAGRQSGNGDFTVGGAPVPPSGAPPSIRTASNAAETDDLDELGSEVNTGTLSRARSTDTHSAMTKAEQAAALTTNLASQNGPACPDGAPTRTFNVSAIQVDIVYNAYGQHDPNGAMYVLDAKKDDVREQVKNSPDATIEDPDANATSSLVQPLTIRAHVGDCVKIQFTNELNKAASMHPTGLSVDPNGSSGQAVGFSGASGIAKPGETVSYTWYVEKKGAFVFTDRAQAVYSDDDGTLREHGLFGSLVAYPEDQKWLDPKTGEPLESGVKAMIEDPDGADYRDYAVYYHDGAGVVNADGSEPTWQHSDAEQSLYTMNYRGDPTGARLEERNESTCPACDKPELFYSSWVHGDPGGGDLVFPSYIGDPVKWRLLGGSVEEKHVDHHHGHRWKSEPGDAGSNTQDSQTISAGAAYTREFIAGFGDGSARPTMSYDEAFEEGGAGYVQGSPGDYIFHCHLFPHYASGMWSVFRVYNKDTRDMNQSAPGIYKLQPLPDREEPPAPNDSAPGYPNFVPAKEDHRPPKPPGNGEREPTSLEESAMNGTGMSDPIVAGAPYVDPCPDDAEEIHYNVSVIRTNITYNQFGDYDDDATIFVLSKNVDEIKNGTMRPRPLHIRANIGQCVTFTLTNELSPDDEPNEISMHTHFVGYDVMGSDGVTLGYNYDEGAEPVGDDESRLVAPENGSAYRVNSTGQVRYRWYADERGTIFWHDHLSGFEKGMHGTFGALIVEPKGSKWLDPKTGEPIRAGSKAIIAGDGFENHREFVLQYQDFTRLHFEDGSQINGPHSSIPLEDQGVMGINYANAPLYHRTEGDPAYAFSSWKHGDPQTPLLRTYPNEPVKVRVLQGTFEESHNFMISGVRWRQEQHDRNSPLTGVQSFGVSEQFVMDFDAPEDNPADLEVEDHLYGSMPVDDIWNGMWGLFRVYGSEVDDLEPVPGHDPPSGVINESELELLNETNDAPPLRPTAGNPCPADAPKRAYSVVAFQANVSYNDYGDSDPYGVVFATEEDYLDWKSNGTELEPLTLRAHKGECLEITLTNKLPLEMSDHSDHARVPVRPQGTWENSNRISLHSTLLKYTARSSGITTGFNYDQTVGPGGTITYRWYADEQVGTTALFDMADVRNHKHHGAYGALVVEPKGSNWLDPETGEPGKSTGPRAIIEQPDGEDFREYVVLAADGQYIVNPDGSCVVPPGHEADPDAPCNQAVGEPEDQGFKSLNYGAEPLHRRLADDSREHLVFSSRVHGDPDTPVFEAYRGDPVKFRVTVPADKPRGVTFELSGHVFPYQSTEQTQYVGVRGELVAGSSTDVVPVVGAGGPQMVSGDYYYGASKLRRYVEGGLWGIFRVHGAPAGIHPLPDRRPDAPTNLSVATPDAERELQLDWDDHPNADVEGYNVYRSAVSGGPYTQVNDALVTSSGFRDTGLLPGTTYHYVVTAVDKYGSESPHSAEASGTTKPLLNLTAETEQTLDAAVNANVTLEMEAESDLGIDRVEVEVDDGSVVEKNATLNTTSGLYEADVDTTALADGDHTVTVRAFDERGQKTLVERPFTADNTDPEAEVSIDGTLVGDLDATQTGNITLEVNATDNTTGVDQVRYRIDDGTWSDLTEQNTSWAGTVDTSVLADGSHEFEVEVKDAAGNVFLKEFSVDTDNTAPAFETKVDGTLADTLDTAVRENVTLEVNASDSMSGVKVVKYKLDDGSWHKLTKSDGKWTKTIDTTTLSDGGHTLHVKGVDEVGNAKTKSFGVDVDNTEPSETTEFDGTEVSLLDSPLSGTSTLQIDASDATSGVETVEFEIDDNGYTTVTDDDGDGVWETDLNTSTLSDGGHDLTVRVTDAAGNVKTSTYTFEVDNTEPSFDAYIDGTLISLLDTALTGDVTLEVDATDATSGVDLVEYEIDDNGYQTVTDDDGDGVWETTIDTTQYSDGSHVLRVKVIDKAGNAKVKEFEVTIDNLL